MGMGCCIAPCYLGVVLHDLLLQMAGTAVRKATETLVEAARRTTVDVEEGKPFGPKVKGGVMADFRRELEIQEEIEKKRKELEMAKEQLYKIRREKRRQN